MVVSDTQLTNVAIAQDKLARTCCCFSLATLKQRLVP